MIKADKESLIILSEVFANLSAGWFASIPIVSLLTKDFSFAEFIQLLTTNSAAGIVAILIAVWLLKRSKRR